MQFGFSFERALCSSTIHLHGKKVESSSASVSIQKQFYSKFLAEIEIMFDFLLLGFAQKVTF